MQANTSPHNIEKGTAKLESRKKSDRMSIRNESETDFNVYGYICDIRDSSTVIPYGCGLCIASGYNRDVIEATNLVSLRIKDCGIPYVDLFLSNLSRVSWVELKEHEVWNTRSEMELAERMRFYIRQASIMIASKSFTKDVIMYLITGDKVYLPKASDEGQNVADFTCDIENTGDASSQDFLDSQKSTWCTSFYQWTLRGFYKFSLFLKNMFQKKL